MKKIITLMIIAAISILIQSCKDIIDCDSNYQKTALFKTLTSSDSLRFLTFNELDMGNVKIRGTNTIDAAIENNTKADIVTIYSIKNKNTSGLFEYSYPKGLPFQIIPGENTENTEKIRVKFISDAFTLTYFYDTLIFNNNKDFFLPIKIKVRY